MKIASTRDYSLLNEQGRLNTPFLPLINFINFISIITTSINPLLKYYSWKQALNLQAEIAGIFPMNVYVHISLSPLWTVTIYLLYSRLPDTTEFASSSAICSCSSFSDCQCRLKDFGPTSAAVSLNVIFCSKHLVVPIPPVKGGSDIPT